MGSTLITRKLQCHWFSSNLLCSILEKPEGQERKKKVLQAVGNLSEREGIFCGLEGLVVCDHLVLGEEETTISLVATQM